MIKSFKGKLDSGEQDTIRLGTIRGQIGYTIKKFKLMNNLPGQETAEAVCKIFTYEQTSIDGAVDFDNSELLAAAYLSTTSSGNAVYFEGVIFDNVKFNQDIYVTHKDTDNGLPINYYIELEQHNLSVDEATVATLKDMRGSN
jgi:hypothetical protein